MTGRAVGLLVVKHSRTGSTGELVEAALEGVREAESALGPAEPGGDPDPGRGPVPHLDTRVLGALDAGPSDVLWSDGLLLATPANFGYMSGALKDFFERIYHPCLGHTTGRPYALIVKGDTDTSGAVSSVERIVTGLGWRAVLPPFTVTGDLRPEDRERAFELGATLAAGLLSGVF